MKSFEVRRTRAEDSTGVPELEYDVEVGEWDTSEGKIGTTSASTCVILAGHNTQTRKGIVGHFTAATCKIYEYNRLQAQEYKFVVRESLIDLGDPQYTNLWLGGAALGHIDDDGTLKDREFSEETVKDVFGPNAEGLASFNAEWGEEGSITAVELDNPASKLTVVSFIKANNNSYGEMGARELAGIT